MDKARFDTRGKLAHVLYALLIFIVGAAIAGEAEAGSTRRAAGRAPVEGLLSDFSDHTTGIDVLHGCGFTRAY